MCFHQQYLSFLQIINIGKTFFVTPLMEFAHTIAKKRDNNLRHLLIIQMLAYAIYWAVTEYYSIIYLYMLKVSTHSKKLKSPSL